MAKTRLINISFKMIYYLQYIFKMKRYIVSNPEILGGKPVISGTRIPVEQILFLLREGFTVEAIQEEYPHLNRKTIIGTVEEAARLINKHAPQIL